MARSTRSGTVFSPYDLDNMRYNPSCDEPQVIDCGIALGPQLQLSIAAADLRAEQFENVDIGQDVGDVDDEWEDLLQLSSRPCSPLSELSDVSSPSSHPPSRPPSASPGAAAALPFHDTLDFTGTPGPLPAEDIEYRRRHHSAAARRARRRQVRAAKATPFERRPSLRHRHGAPTPEFIEASASTLPHAETGWVGLRDRHGPRKPSTIAELEAGGVKIVKWDGRRPLLIVDKDQRIVGVFVGKPDDPQWDSEVIPGACRAMERASSAAKASDARTSAPHRRGNFTAISSGVSFGGGQKVPGNLVHPKWRQRLIARLLKNKYIQRIAGFQSSAFAYWAPKVYKEYADTLRQLFTEYPGLEHNFRNSIFPAVTFNCSPDTVSLSHVDFNNNPAGWCAITSGGRFNHTSGAHLHMSPFKVAVEFPSGTTSLILSGAIEHGNTPILDGETRFSMTQYAAGGLFRWVKYGFKSAKALLAMKGGKEIRAAYDGVAGSRWEKALNLFSTLQGIDCDRQKVFSQA